MTLLAQRTRDEADPPVTEPDQVLGSISPAGPVGRGQTAIDSCGPVPTGSTSTIGTRKLSELLAACIQELGYHEDDARASAGDDTIHPIRRAHRAAMRRLHDQVVAEPAGFGLGASEQRVRPLRLEVGDDEVDSGRRARAEGGARTDARPADARSPRASPRRHRPGRRALSRSSGPRHQPQLRSARS